MLYGNNINGEIPATPAAEMTCGLYGNKPWKQPPNISRILADFLESTSYSSAIFLAKGPDIIIEMVLFVVAISATLTKLAIPNSAPRFDFNL